MGLGDLLRGCCQRVTQKVQDLLVHLIAPLSVLPFQGIAVKAQILRLRHCHELREVCPDLLGHSVASFIRAWPLELRGRFLAGELPASMAAMAGPRHDFAYLKDGRFEGPCRAVVLVCL